MAGVEHLRSPLGTAAVAMTLRAVDGVRLAAAHLPRRAGGRDIAVVLAHGFSGSHTSPWQARLARRLSSYAGVVAFDFRGHGRSDGRSTLGELEVLDVDAAVAAARMLGYGAVITCGWSMGGSAVLRHAALHGGVDGVVCVSATSRWGVRDTAAMRRLHWLVERPLGRRVSRHLLRTRLVDSWGDEPESPVEVVSRIAPTPLLLIHGDRDAYFGLDHPYALAAAAGEPTQLWVVPGFGHAESGATPALVDRIGRHLPALLAQRAGVR